MAAVVTTINDSGVLENWTASAGPTVPKGSVLYSNTAFAIAAKISTNEMTINITLTLPQSYFYRLLFVELNLRAPLLADLEDYEKGARVTIFPGGVESRRFPIYNLTELATAGAEPGFKSDPDGVTDDFGTFFGPLPGTPIGAELIDGTSQIANTILIRLVDTSADATSAMLGAYRVRVLQYTVDQARLSGVHTPTLIV